MTLPVKWSRYEGELVEAVQMETPTDAPVATLVWNRATEEIFIAIESSNLFAQWIKSSEEPLRTIEVHGTLIGFNEKNWTEFLRICDRLIQNNKIKPEDLGFEP